MSILVGEDTKVIVQGITGRDGSFHTEQMLDYGTNIVGGVTPGKGGQTIFALPVFNSMAEAVDATGANASVIYVPAKFAKQAMLDAAESNIDLLVVITEGIPTLEEYKAHKEQCKAAAKDYIGTDVEGYPDFYSEADVEAYIASSALHEVDQHALRAMTMANIRDVAWIEAEDQRMAKVRAAMAKD